MVYFPVAAALVFLFLWAAGAVTRTVNGSWGLTNAATEAVLITALASGGFFDALFHSHMFVGHWGPAVVVLMLSAARIGLLSSKYAIPGRTRSAVVELLTLALFAAGGLFAPLVS